MIFGLLLLFLVRSSEGLSRSLQYARNSKFDSFDLRIEVNVNENLRLSGWRDGSHTLYAISSNAKECDHVDEEEDLDAIVQNLSLVPGPGDNWMHRACQLLEYRRKNGSTLVPKRFKENPALGNWVNKQRQLYRIYAAGESCALTPERVAILNHIGFVWNASSARKPSPTCEQASEDWWRVFKGLSDDVAHLTEISQSATRAEAFWDISIQSSYGRWIQKQRIAVERLRLNLPSALNQDQLFALESIDRNWWMNKQQRKWQLRYDELKEYQQEYGDCCVPISSTTHKKLANWVSNQRKNYKLKMAGRQSNLTKYRVDRLNEIGFVWSHWDYEFERKEERAEKMNLM